MGLELKRKAQVKKAITNLEITVTKSNIKINKLNH